VAPLLFTRTVRVKSNGATGEDFRDISKVEKVTDDAPRPATCQPVSHYILHICCTLLMCGYRFLLSWYQSYHVGHGCIPWQVLELTL